MSATWQEVVTEVAESHLIACNQALFDMEDLPTEHLATLAVEDPAFAPYCGCERCIVREVLTAALPIITAGVRQELEKQPWTPEVCLQQAIREGLTFGQAVAAFAANGEDGDDEYAEAARQRANDVEIDDPTIVSRGGDAGAYVMGWVWVADDEMEED